MRQRGQLPDRRMPWRMDRANQSAERLCGGTRKTIMNTTSNEAALPPASGSAWSIYQINDCDWWVAKSLNEAIVDALRDCYGMKISDSPTPEELLPFEGAELCDARELTAEEMDRLMFREEWVDEDTYKPIDRTFRAELTSRIESGTIAVGMFASTEC